MLPKPDEIKNVIKSWIPVVIKYPILCILGLITTALWLTRDQWLPTLIERVFGKTKKEQERSKNQKKRLTTKRLTSLGRFFLILCILYYGFYPFYLANSLTLRESVILSQAAYWDFKEAVDFYKEHSTIFVSMEEPARTSIVFSSHQRLVELGLLEDGPLSQRKGIYVSPDKERYKADLTMYATDITAFGRIVSFWKFGVFGKLNFNHSN